MEESGQLHVPATLLPGKRSRYTIDRGMSGPQSWSGRYEKGWRIFVAPSGESIQPASLVTAHTALSHFHKSTHIYSNIDSSERSQWKLSPRDLKQMNRKCTRVQTERQFLPSFHISIQFHFPLFSRRSRTGVGLQIYSTHEFARDDNKVELPLRSSQKHINLWSTHLCQHYQKGGVTLCLIN